MIPLLSTAILLVCFVHSIRSAGDEERPTVKTPLGTFIGILEDTVKVFLGVPYAVAPVGDLRFKEMVPVKNSKKTFEADKMPPACPQYSEQPLPWYDTESDQSEDCLYLNIWVPANITKGTKRAVKMYVHGGGWFDAGSNRMGYYDGFSEATDTMDEDGNSKEDGIIVVTINYRLGALGFASYSDRKSCPGNMGLSDIFGAFRWLLNNINYFGGGEGFSRDLSLNPPITIAGQGSGAILASLLRFAKSANTHIKMILNGATFFSLVSLEGVDNHGDAHDNNLRLADLLVKEVGCERNNSEDAVSCLRDVEASRLVRVAASLSQGRGPPNVFMPEMTGPSRVLLENPYNYMHDLHNFFMFDALDTITSDEGSILLTSAFPEVFGVFGEKDIPLSGASAKNITRKLLKNFPVTVSDELLGDLDQTATVANRDKVVQALGDAYFNCPIVYYSEEMKRDTDGKANPNKVYLLEKKVIPPYNPWGSWMGSVGFDNVQIDFGHPDGQLAVNNQTYKYTDEQSKQMGVNLDIIKSYMSTREVKQFPEFTREDPAYGFLDSDGNLSEEKKSNFHGRNCDILRPYYIRPKPALYGSSPVYWE